MKNQPVGRKWVLVCVVVALAAMIGCSASDQTFTGTVEQGEKGLVLKTEDGANTYRVVENPDLRALVGKKVQLTGTLMDRQAGKSIAVSKFEVVGE